MTPSYPPTRAATVLAEAELPTAILDLARTGEGHDADLGILAPSLVFGPTENRVLSDVFGVDCVVTSHSTTITAWTRSDIWMPYNVMAQSQSMVAMLNAPRLRAALEAIERIVGSPGFAEDSPFAKVDGYELRNHIVRSDVLDLQDMGYDESWIAEHWPEPDPSFDEPAP